MSVLDESESEINKVGLVLIPKQIGEMNPYLQFHHLRLSYHTLRETHFDVQSLGASFF